MKNIFILPTDQPSRLVKIKDTFFLTTTDDIPGGTFYNIHITNDEEIKKDEYYLGDDNHIYNLVTSVNNNGKKIILTIDPTLIADGVQDIDDEFLKWFVKNPSCEFVEVNKKLVEFPLTFKMMYKIIIPQDEPKQDLEKEMFELEQELDIPSSMRWHNSKPKQETLKEVAERLFPDSYIQRVIFRKGAKWQAERMYSEEDLREAFKQSRQCKIFEKDMPPVYKTFEEWFENFKKK